jgi:uncharacterized Zn finger protein
MGTAFPIFKTLTLALVVRTEGLSYMDRKGKVYSLEFANAEVAATVEALNKG